MGVAMGWEVSRSSEMTTAAKERIMGLLPSRHQPQTKQHSTATGRSEAIDLTKPQRDWDNQARKARQEDRRNRRHPEPWTVRIEVSRQSHTNRVCHVFFVCSLFVCSCSLSFNGLLFVRS